MNRKRRFQTNCTPPPNRRIPNLEEFKTNLAPLKKSLDLASAFELYNVYYTFVQEGYSIEILPSSEQYHRLILIKAGLSESTVIIPISCSKREVAFQLLTDLVDQSSSVVLLAWVAYDGTFTVYRTDSGIRRPDEKQKKANTNAEVF